MPKTVVSDPPTRGRRGRNAPPDDARGVQLAHGAAPGAERAPAIPDDAGDDEQLGALLAEFGGATGYAARVERKDARGGADYLGTLELTADLLDDVRAAWGGGKYRARIVDADKRYVRSIQFGIAGAPRDPEALATPAPGRAPAAEPDRLERLELAIGGLAEGLRALSAPKPPDTLDMFGQFAKLMRELAPQTVPAAATTPATALESMTAMLEFQTQLENRVGPRGGGTDFTAFVQPALKLVEVLDKKISLEREAMYRRRPIAVVQPVTETPAPTAAADSLEHLARSLPPFAVAFLAGCAKADKSAELYAETVIDNLPGEIQDALPTLLAGDDAADRLCAIVPAWGAFVPWFRELVAAILASLEADDADDALEATG